MDILEIAVSPSTLGELEVTLLKMLMSTRKMVTRSVILPGTISGGMRKLTQDTGKRMCDCELIMERFTEDKKA